MEVVTMLAWFLVAATAVFGNGLHEIEEGSERGEFLSYLEESVRIKRDVRCCNRPEMDENLERQREECKNEERSQKQRENAEYVEELEYTETEYEHIEGGEEPETENEEQSERRRRQAMPETTTERRSRRRNDLQCVEKCILEKNNVLDADGIPVKAIYIRFKSQTYNGIGWEEIISKETDRCLKPLERRIESIRNEGQTEKGKLRQCNLARHLERFVDARLQSKCPNQQKLSPEQCQKRRREKNNNRNRGNGDNNNGRNTTNPSGNSGYATGAR